MLLEIPYIKNIQDEPQRRWFADDDFDLIVWYGTDGRIVGFQLCYDKEGDQRAFTWKESGVARHDRVDDGESEPGRYKSTPILIPDGAFDSRRIIEQFRNNSAQIDPLVASFVLSKLNEWHPPKPEIRRPQYRA